MLSGGDLGKVYSHISKWDLQSDNTPQKTYKAKSEEKQSLETILRMLRKPTSVIYSKISQ